MSRVTASRTSRARFSSPSVCPSVRGSPRLAAHRPLPSMMQATCRDDDVGRRCSMTGGSGGAMTRQVHASQTLIRRRGVEEWWRWQRRSRRPLASFRSTRQLLRHVMIVGGTLARLGQLGRDRWRPARRSARGGRRRRRRLVPQLRAFEPGVDPVDLDRWERRIGDCHVTVDPCGDGRKRFAEAMRGLPPDEPVNEATITEALYSPGRLRTRPDRHPRRAESAAARRSSGSWPTASWSSTRSPGRNSRPTISSRPSPISTSASADSAASTNDRDRQADS